MEEAQAKERTEQLIEQAYTYLREKTYPDGWSETRKRVIRKKAAKFEVKDGELYYKQKQNGKVILVDPITLSQTIRFRAKNLQQRHPASAKIHTVK